MTSSAVFPLAAAVALVLPLPLAGQGGGMADRDTAQTIEWGTVGIRVGGAQDGPPDAAAPVPRRRPDPTPPAPVLPPSVAWRAPFPLAPPAVAYGAAAEGPAPAVINAAGATAVAATAARAARAAGGAWGGEGTVRAVDGVVDVGAGIDLDFPAAPPPVGTRLQLWRPGPDDGFGRPVAVATVTAPARGQLVALFDRVRAGDRLRPLPRAPALEGHALEAVSGGRRAVVLGVVPDRPLVRPGDWVVLDAGREAGLHPGAELVPVGGADDLRGETRLQVVAAHSLQSIARVAQLGTTLPAAGVVVRLDRRVRRQRTRPNPNPL